MVEEYSVCNICKVRQSVWVANANNMEDRVCGKKQTNEKKTTPKHRKGHSFVLTPE